MDCVYSEKTEREKERSGFIRLKMTGLRKQGSELSQAGNHHETGGRSMDLFNLLNPSGRNRPWGLPSL
jgi:hypothetical protein